MVKIKETKYILPDGTIHIETWLSEIAKKRQSHQTQQIEHACALALVSGGDSKTHYGLSCLHLGINMAELLIDLKADQTSVAAAVLYHTAVFSELQNQDIAEQMGSDVAKLIKGAQQMDAIRSLYGENLTHPQLGHDNIDKLRKMLLAMVSDVRVVLLKLAEITIIARAATKLDKSFKQKIAQEMRHIYAPLANRLGIGQIKWELEDFSLRFTQPDTYKEIAKSIAQKRIERDKYISIVIETLQQELKKAGMSEVEITGRSKHIYSIYRKMQRKHVDFDQIYDVSAVRILVQKVEDCYSALGVVHGLWEHIPEEFDDYITNPKPNGYRSLHTAVIGPNNRNLEVQIRTHEMHNESEMGVAAHWKYKEGGQQGSDYESKIAWLRQILEWQQELSEEQNRSKNTSPQQILEDRVYIFTPAGEIIDLPKNSTPLDFAYIIHTEIGHRCRGAKVNGKIVPLTYQLHTGERVEILTNKNPSPSRDWLNPQAGYLISSRSRAKVHHWFKKLDYEKNIIHGHDLLDAELSRQQLKRKIDRATLTKAVSKFNFQQIDDLYAAIGAGSLRPLQVVNYLQTFVTEPSTEADRKPKLRAAEEPAPSGSSDVIIRGAGDLMSFNAGCCKPVPGDAIIGFVTRGRGVSVHRRDCPNIVNNPEQERLIETEWRQSISRSYPVDLILKAGERQGLINDILAVLSNKKIDLNSITTRTNGLEGVTTILFTISIHENSTLQDLLQSFRQIPDVMDVQRRYAISHKKDKNND